MAKGHNAQAAQPWTLRAQSLKKPRLEAKPRVHMKCHSSMSIGRTHGKDGRKTDQGTRHDGVSAVHLGGLPLRLRAVQLMVRQEQKGLELTAEGLASASESLLRGENKGFRVPSFGHGAAAQDDDVPYGALGGLDGACSLLVATIGDVADHDERVGRVLGAGPAELEEVERVLDEITAALVSETTLP